MKTGASPNINLSFATDHSFATVILLEMVKYSIKISVHFIGNQSWIGLVEGQQNIPSESHCISVL